MLKTVWRRSARRIHTADDGTRRALSTEPDTSPLPCRKCRSVSLCWVSRFRLSLALRFALMSRRRNIRCIKRERTVLFNALYQSPGQAILNARNKRMRPYRRISTHMPFRINLNMSSILVERLVSVDANSRRSGFLPPHQSSAVSAQAYLRKTPRIIPYFPPTKNPRRKSAGVLHQSTNHHPIIGVTQGLL